MKSKRPISVWFTQVILLLMGLASGASAYDTYVKIDYSIRTMVLSPTQWFDGLTCIACLVAFTGLCFRWRFARWLSVVVLGVNACMGAYTFLQIGPDPDVEIISAVLGLTVVILPLLLLAVLLIASRKVKVFFGLSEPTAPDEMLPLPPSPPTFEES